MAHSVGKGVQFWINGTASTDGRVGSSSVGQSGYFYPLFVSQSEANAYDLDKNGLGQSHAHTFEGITQTFYMPSTGATHASINRPTGIRQWVGDSSLYIDKMSKQVREQFPDFYKEDGEKFLLFIEAYYEYLEQNGKALDAVHNLMSYRDATTTIDEFISNFINSFLPNVPLDVVADKNLMVKYIKYFNQSRGTIASYRLLFKALYNEDIEIEYPADQILKVSDGEWNIDQYLVAVFDQRNYNFIGKTIKGIESQAEALVEDVSRKTVKGRDINQIIVSNVRGTFNNLEPIRLLTDVNSSGHTPKIEAGIYKITIDSVGGEYQAGDVLKIISSFNGDFGKVVVTSVQDLGGSLTLSLVNGGSGYTASTEPDGSVIEFIGGDSTDEASFQIGTSDISDTFAISINTDLLSSNTLFGANAPVIADPELTGGDPEGSAKLSTFANMIIGSPDYGFREQGQTDNNLNFRDHIDAVLVVANTTDPGVQATDSLFGETSGANATVKEILRSYNSTDVILKIDGYKNFSTSEKINLSTSDGTTIGTVSSFFANTVGIQAVEIGIISGNELSEGDIVGGRTSGTIGIVRHVGTADGNYNSTLVVANTVDPQIKVGDILNGETSGANAVVQHIDSVYNEGTDTVELMVRNYGSSFTSSEKVNVITFDSAVPFRANGETVGTVDSFSLGGRDLYTYRIGAVNTTDSVTYQANVSTQFDTGPMGSFIADEGIYDVTTDTTVGNVAYSTTNTSIENAYSQLRHAFNFEASTFGTIVSLGLPLGGSGYTLNPTIRVTEPDIAALGIGEVVLTLQSDDVNWDSGNSNFTTIDTNERIVQSSTGASGDVKGSQRTGIPISTVQYANGTYETQVRVFQDFLQREPQNINYANDAVCTIEIYDQSYTPGTSDTRQLKDTATAKIVSIEDRGVLGKNAVITSGIGANGTLTGLRVLDSGFAYRDGEVVIIQATNRRLATSASGTVELSGVANSEGYYTSARSHLSSQRSYIQDSNYYQEFSYQVNSPISLDRFRDIALNLTHPAGQKLFGAFRIQSNASIDVQSTANTSTSSVISGTVSVAKTLASGTIAIQNGNTHIVGTSTDFTNEFSASDSLIIEIDPGDGIANKFVEVSGSIYTSTNTVLSEPWIFTTQTSANVYYANSIIVTGSGTSFTTEFNDGDEIIFVTSDNEFVTTTINSVRTDTELTLNKNWTLADLSGAECFSSTVIN
jgi:hypothetical protein